jgi:hypothetical protein
MDKESIYSREEIEEICKEVERQWEYHLLARGAFPINPEGLTEYQSSDFYIEHGVLMKVSIPGPMSPVMQRGLAGIHQWLNQNYIIRLYGILDQYKVLTAGKKLNNPYINILYGLRQKIGAHSSGYRNPKDYDARKLTKLIQEHLDPSIGDERVHHFNLAIDTVLYKMKEDCIKFIRSLEGEPIPSSSSTRHKI